MEPIEVTTARLTGAVDAVRDAEGGPFEVATYSWMKHGDVRAADVFAARLAARLIAAVPSLVTDSAPLVLPVAWLAVPPSCHVLAERVLARLDDARFGHGNAPGRIVQVHKDSVTHTDYATASQADRAAELSRIGFALSEPVDGAQVVLIDDVRVTGMAEATILRALADSAPARVVTAYVAVCTPELAASPHVESALNHAAVASILDLVPVVQRGDFRLTIRFLKRALASASLPAFVAAVPRALVEQMYAGALATGPDFVAGYPTGVATLREALGAPEVAHV
ncbi:hypothetical protein G9U51_10740 [Calidifontibacter sp. DB0510]|uniref:Phosphoribosyltransferase n=1 Tax=Metallococcus carri TaxID=1656884 RepID=A0A967EF31_9MICO|nr:phosphoribosyltransferase family protein [Metallococcus carri]NHN56251.1 hypothetical protein [Metallococcus carri]NOP38697.1 hypothetical protein [Calidifontibacter sp. DB2511S]